MENARGINSNKNRGVGRSPLVAKNVSFGQKPEAKMFMLIVQQM